jgi:hypothetical protein
MRILFSMTVFAMTACATVVPQPKPAGTSESQQAPVTLTITGADLKQTGRMELSDALRASSPIFH